MNARWILRFFGLLLVLSLAKHMYLARYAHPAADDFCYAAKAQGMSVGEWSSEEYHNWNGRYTSNVLMAHGPLRWSANFLPPYRSVPLALMALTFFCAWFLVRRITGGSLHWSEEALGALLFPVMYMHAMPDIGEGFYWYTGAVTYQLASALMLIHLGVLISGAGKMNLQQWVACALLAMVIVGMSEVHMVLMVLLHLARLVRRIALGTTLTSGLLSLTTLVLACAAVMVFAPGNAVRSAFFPAKHELLHALGMTALQTARFLAVWILSPALLAASVLYVRVHRRLRMHVPHFAAGFHLKPWTSLLMLIGLVAACVFPAYWSTGILGQYRTLNVAYFFFIPLWFINLSVLLEHPKVKMRPPLVLKPITLPIGIALILLSVNCTKNGYRAYGDLFEGRAVHYDQVMLQREALLRSASSKSTEPIRFLPLVNKPLTIGAMEETNADQHWMTTCEARYFGVQETRVIIAPSNTLIPE